MQPGGPLHELMTRADQSLPDLDLLIVQARKGDGEAFSAVCEILSPRLLRQAGFLCGQDTAMAEDLVQETLVAAWKSLDRYHGGCRFFTWLCAIMVRQLNHLQRRRRPTPWSALDAANDDHGHWEQATEAESQPDQQALSAEQIAHLRACLAQLSPAHREVVYLRFYVDQSLSSIAEACGCSMGTVKSRLFHALKYLRAMAAAEPTSSLTP